MKKLYRLVAFLLLASWACLAQGPPTNMPNAVIATFPGAPSSTCSPTMIATRTDTGAFYDCFGGMWTAVSSGAGTVTSVPGTANQISVATATTAPVISLPSAITLPGTLALASGTHGAPVASNTSGQLATSAVSIDASVQAGADWSVKVNAAITALGANAGTIDARGFTSAQAMSANITIPVNTTLLLPCVTISRRAGIEFTLQAHSRVKGCGRTTTIIQNNAGDAGPVFVQNPTSSGVVDMEVSDLEIGSAATGSIGLYLTQAQNSHFSNLLIATSTAIKLGGTGFGGCACYNDFNDVFASGPAYGVYIDEGSNQNHFYGGKYQGGTSGIYIAATSGSNLFLGIDNEGGSATASIDIYGTQNVFIKPYLEANIAGILLESGAMYNYILMMGDIPGNYTDNSGNATNWIIQLNGTPKWYGPVSFLSAITTVGAAGFFNGLDIGTGGVFRSGADTSNFRVGPSALGALTAGTAKYNVGIGTDAGARITTGLGNIAIGAEALAYATTASYNVAIGYNSQSNTPNSGAANTSVGYKSMNFGTSGSNGTAIGYEALGSQTTGGNNTALGYFAGLTATAGNANVSGSNNTWIGFKTGPNTATQLSNATAIGNLALNSASNQVVLGNASVTDVYMGSVSAAANEHAATFNKVTLTPPATGSTLTIADGKTLTASNTITFTAGTDSQTAAVPSAATGSTVNVAQTICSGQVTLAASGNAMSTGTKFGASSYTPQTITCTGLATTDNIKLDFASDPSAVTGFGPSAAGGLTIVAYPTANTINIYVYNDTVNTVRPGSININYRAAR